MPVTYIERRRISRNKFIGFTPIGDRSVARRRIPRRSRFYSIGCDRRHLVPFWSSVDRTVDLTGNQADFVSLNTKGGK